MKDEMLRELRDDLMRGPAMVAAIDVVKRLDASLPALLALADAGRRYEWMREAELAAVKDAMANAEHDAGDFDDANEDEANARNLYEGLRKLLAISAVVMDAPQARMEYVVPGLMYAHCTADGAELDGKRIRLVALTDGEEGA